MKLIRIGDNVINVEQITRIELESTGYDYDKHDSVAATRVYFGSAYHQEMNPDSIVLHGDDRVAFKAWLISNSADLTPER